MSTNRAGLPRPNFLIAGATASGTTFLSHVLHQHPEIYLPPDPNFEPHFFSITKRYELGMAYYLKTFFSNRDSQVAIGERSTSYFHFPEAAYRISKNLPSCKLILVLRNPVQRAWAQYRYMVLRGKESLSFQEAILAEKKRYEPLKRHHEYIGRSLYGNQLANLLNYFSIHQILILSSERLKDETTLQLNKITDFLEISPFSTYTPAKMFSSPQVLNRGIQIVISQHFGKEFKHIVEAIRERETPLDPFIHSAEDKYYIDLLLNNLTYSSTPQPNDIPNHILNMLDADMEKFFSISGDHIDFTPWTVTDHAI